MKHALDLRRNVSTGAFAGKQEGTSPLAVSAERVSRHRETDGRRAEDRRVRRGCRKDRALKPSRGASPPEDSRIALTIERLPGAKVSSPLCEEVQPGFSSKSAARSVTCG